MESVILEDEEAKKLFSTAVEEMKISTRQYAKSQRGWITRKLMPEIRKAMSKGDDENHIFLLDGTGK